MRDVDRTNHTTDYAQVPALVTVSSEAQELWPSGKALGPPRLRGCDLRRAIARRRVDRRGRREHLVLRCAHLLGNPKVRVECTSAMAAAEAVSYRRGPVTESKWSERVSKPMASVREQKCTKVRGWWWHTLAASAQW